MSLEYVLCHDTSYIRDEYIQSKLSL